jgi:hypothetical protein
LSFPPPSFCLCCARHSLHFTVSNTTITLNHSFLTVYRWASSNRPNPTLVAQFLVHVWCVQGRFLPSVVCVCVCCRYPVQPIYKTQSPPESTPPPPRPCISPILVRERSLRCRALNLSTPQLPKGSAAASPLSKRPLASYAVRIRPRRNLPILSSPSLPPFGQSTICNRLPLRRCAVIPIPHDCQPPTNTVIHVRGRLIPLRISDVLKRA